MSKESSNPLKFIIFCIFVLTSPVLLPNADGKKPGPGTDQPTTLVAPSWRHTLGLNRVRQSHLDMYSRYRKRFSEPQGIVAMKHRFNDQEGPKDDDELTVYGLNSGSGEIIFNTSRMSLGFFSDWPGENSGFLRPVGIAADREGWLAVSDAGHNRVVYLRNEANRLYFVRSLDFGQTGLALKSPSGVAIENSRLYIADSGNDRIVITNQDGELVGTIGQPGPGSILDRPFGLAVIEQGDWNHYGSTFIIVTDSLRQRVQMLSLRGEPIAARRFSEISGDSGGFYFAAVDYYSNVYVTDTRAGWVYKFDRFLNYLTRIGSGGGRETDLVQPRGITIYRRFGQIFLAERAGASYYWVGTDILNLRPEARISEDLVGLEVRFTLTEQSQVTMVLETAAGETADTLDQDLFLAPGQVQKFYQLTGQIGQDLVANRKYNLTATATATYSSRRYFSARKTALIRIR